MSQTRTDEAPNRLLLVADRGGEDVGHLVGALGNASAMKPVKVATW
ncbi:hypothetical protein OHA27_36240 [Streptomyces sp. NBC_01619]|uniref:Uncharacterized protein n=1 Tax=Streptomyces pratisoli TaxID=3139917 RepID=A0ACC6Q9W8_9ACTN|nr:MULTISPECIES: hypothetical protein [unclassified Streptomyces]MCX4515653.1 hypothetical protein [Streptomyces sp. NBC_01619]